ncbi:hypothetical protein J6590_066824 [Homalodisca vitripennis]|nr:hypothetical protein J6590_066824 [Homalodisca vitripennis]
MSTIGEHAKCTRYRECAHIFGSADRGFPQRQSVVWHCPRASGINMDVVSDKKRTHPTRKSSSKISAVVRPLVTVPGTRRPPTGKV